MKTIVIDPGHGGYDNGATGDGRLEKDDNLRLGLLVRDRLKARGQNVIMTRDSDIYVPLLERSRISNRNNADIFVSLHRNAFVGVAANGVENYVQTGSAAVNTVYARNVLNEVVNAGVQSNRGVKQNSFSVLRNTFAPAQLLEMGFITNRTDNLMFDKYIDAYADAIAKGILESLGLPWSPAPAPPENGRAAAKAIQETLNSRYSAGLAVDGIYGARTKAALIKGLQTELNKSYNAGLKADGLWGPRTNTAVRNVRRGDRGNIPFILQAALSFNGHEIAADGVFGPATEDAVKSFQRSKDLMPDGVAGKNTFAALFS